MFYSHVNYSVTKIEHLLYLEARPFYSHVNYSVTKMKEIHVVDGKSFTVT